MISPSTLVTCMLAAAGSAIAVDHDNSVNQDIIISEAAYQRHNSATCGGGQFVELYKKMPIAINAQETFLGNFELRIPEAAARPNNRQYPQVNTNHPLPDDVIKAGQYYILCAEDLSFGKLSRNLELQLWAPLGEQNTLTQIDTFFVGGELEIHDNNSMQRFLTTETVNGVQRTLDIPSFVSPGFTNAARYCPQETTVDVDLLPTDSADRMREVTVHFANVKESKMNVWHMVENRSGEAVPKVVGKSIRANGRDLRWTVMAHPDTYWKFVGESGMVYHTGTLSGENPVVHNCVYEDVANGLRKIKYSGPAAFDKDTITTKKVDKKTDDEKKNKKPKSNKDKPEDEDKKKKDTKNDATAVSVGLVSLLLATTAATLDL